VDLEPTEADRKVRIAVPADATELSLEFGRAEGPEED